MQTHALDVTLEAPDTFPGKRRHPRANVRALVLWDHRRREGDQGIIMDISASGLLLTGEYGAPGDVCVGDPIWGRFKIGEVEHHFAGVVRWRGFSERHQVEGVGVEFNKLTPLARQDLEAFVARAGVK